MSSLSKLMTDKPKRHIFTTLISFFLFIAMYWLYSLNHEETIANHQLTLEIAEISTHNGHIKNLPFLDNTVIFKNHQSNFINLGQRDALWLRATLPETGVNNGSAQPRILVLKKNRIKTPVELHYLTRDKGWVKKVVHGSAQFHQNIVIRLPEEVLNQHIYLKLHGRYLRATFYLFNDDGFFKDLQLSSFTSGLFFGILLLFSLYHIMLYTRLKTPSYLAYSVMLLLLATWFLSGQGWLEYIFPKVKFLSNITVIAGGLLMVSIGEFAKHYLNIKIFSKRVYQLLVFAQLLLLLLLAARLSLNNLLPSIIKQATYSLGLLACFIIFISCFSAAIIGVKKQHTAAKYYLAATLLFFVMACTMALSAGNVIDFYFSWPLLQLTSAIEVIIFSAGLVSVYYQQQQNEKNVELQLQQAQQKLVKQLEISNALKDKVLNNQIDHKIFPELAKITALLPDIIYVQALGNESLVVYQKKHRQLKIELNCNLQSLLESFGSEYLIRVHKSYLINPLQSLSLQRRTSADYDLQLNKATVPVGRKYINELKKLV